MKITTLFLFLLLSSIVSAAQEGGQPDSKRDVVPTQSLCDAIARKLHDSGTNKAVVTMTLDTHGRVESFNTESPKGLRLEKMKEASAIIKSWQFGPATKNGRPVRVKIGMEIDFHCTEPATDTPKKP
jgi:Gram-negative bacterial TonB protein C-terminal